MDAALPLPSTTAELIAAVPLSGRHPGLQLEKYIPFSPQGQRDKSLAEVCQAGGESELFEALLQRRETCLNSIGAVQWRSTTAAPLTLHLAQTSAAENAGIGLHPLYGFVCLPGGGLKGMARAYAQTVWLDAQYQRDAAGRPADATEHDKAAAARRMIEAVFGSTPPNDATDPTRSARRGKRHTERIGSIVFHEAWPETWPKLELDIANNHHAAYYQGSDSRDAPGDWESPAKVSFLTVGPGQAFRFALSKRRAEVADDLLEHARQWLQGALVHEGAGAKTSAGYGLFNPEPSATGTVPIFVSAKMGLSPLPSLAGEVFETALELVTPAFLAGAKQEANDCQLRVATLRGQLRWWWRTMHAGFVEVAALRRLEAAVWGDAHVHSAVRVSIEPQTPALPVLYDHKERFSPKRDFQKDHQLQQPPNQKTVQGLFYASYGIDDGQHKRYYLSPGTRWTVRLVARQSWWESQDLRGNRTRTTLNPATVLQQAKAALWLLTHFGGVGSKSRKGFGSFADIFAGDISSLEDCRRAAADFRLLCRCDGPFQDRLAESLALERARRLDDVSTAWKDCWFALDQLGYAFQSFAQRRRHDRAKAALGLPRSIHGPRREPGYPQAGHGQNRASHRPPEQLSGPKGDRHASPVFYHFGRTADGGLLVRVTAFLTKHLPDLLTSTTVLNQLLTHLDNELRKRAAQPGPESRPPAAAVPGKPPKPAGPRAMPKAGHWIEAVLVEDPKGKGRRFAQHVGSGLVGPILNPERVPPDKNVGDAVRLLVFSISSDGKQIQWRVPTEADKPPVREPRGGPPRGPSRRR